MRCLLILSSNECLAAATECALFIFIPTRFGGPNLSNRFVMMMRERKALLSSSSFAFVPKISWRPFWFPWKKKCNLVLSFFGSKGPGNFLNKAPVMTFRYYFGIRGAEAITREFLGRWKNLERLKLLRPGTDCVPSILLTTPPRRRFRCFQVTTCSA